MTYRQKYFAAYYQANRDRIRAAQNARSATRRVENNARERARYWLKREEISARVRLKLKTNRKAENARIRRWEKANPEKARALRARRKARLRGAPVRDLTAADWRRILAAHGHRCAYCGAQPEKLTQDHVIPLSKGGSHTASNVVPACLSCNCSKGARLL